MFDDRVKIFIKSGDGGNGKTSFLTETAHFSLKTTTAVQLSVTIQTMVTVFV